MKNLLSVKLVTLALLAVLIVVPVGGILTTPDDAMVPAEQRTVRAFPKQFSKRFFLRLGEYVQDRVLLRAQTMDLLYPLYLKNFIEFDLTPASFSVRGKDNMWFLGNKNNRETDQHSLYFPAKEVEQEINNWVHDVKYLQEETGLPVKIFIAPDKTAVYSELMPPYRNMGKVRLVDHLLEQAQRKDLEIYDALPALLKAKAEKQELLWLRNDSHWNLLGAYRGYCGFMQSIQLAPVQADFTPARAAPTGDLLAYDLKIDYPTTDSFYAVSSAPLKIKANLANQETAVLTGFKNMGALYDQSPAIFENPNAPYSEALILIGDSFMSAVISYFAASFEKVVCLNTYSASLEDIAKQAREHRASMIVFESVERCMLICAHQRHRQ